MMHENRLTQAKSSIYPAVLALLLSWPAAAWTDETATVAPPEAPSLGQIQLDREMGQFSVPGRFLERGPDQGRDLLEYLAVKRNGYKAYEAVLELDTTATEFNLACILIGLDPDNATLPEYHFDPRPVQGDPVDIHVEWDADGTLHRARAAELILMNGKPVDDHGWVYTGSTFIEPGNIYLAEQSGTLIGFVHDADSIIEHRHGIALNAPQAPSVNRALMPPPQTPIRVIIRNPAETAGQDDAAPSATLAD
ncbi:hypothetical protein CKO40_00065 [Halochromatium glycolicum]|uniref:Secreted protein n=2 Tax=Halochromatium glycolicum TaxID=85075 RepID=A0AAJ0U179_9GAMM|nr:hypothetical protein [Halochromatium glycolicum]